MAVNSQVTSAIQAQAVPPDRECVSNLTEILQGVQDFASVVTVAGETPGGTNDSVAQQALEVANVALQTANQALAATPNKRSSGEPLAIAAGDSVFPLTWSPAMPDTNYEVRLTYFGANVAVAAYYNYRVVDGSRTVNNCSVRLDNTPVNTKISWVVEAL